MARPLVDEAIDQDPHLHQGAPDALQPCRAAVVASDPRIHRRDHPPPPTADRPTMAQARLRAAGAAGAGLPSQERYVRRADGRVRRWHSHRLEISRRDRGPAGCSVPGAAPSAAGCQEGRASPARPARLLAGLRAGAHPVRSLVAADDPREDDQRHPGTGRPPPGPRGRSKPDRCDPAAQPASKRWAKARSARKWTSASACACENATCTSLLTYYFLGDRDLPSFKDFVYNDLHGSVVVHDRWGRTWVYERLRQFADAGRAVQTISGYWRAAGPPISPRTVTDVRPSASRAPARVGQRTRTSGRGGRSHSVTSKGLGQMTLVATDYGHGPATVGDERRGTRRLRKADSKEARRSRARQGLPERKLPEIL